VFVSHYPWTVMFGDIEMKIFRKLLRDEEMTEEENMRLDQMSSTLERMCEKKEFQSNEHSHRIVTFSHSMHKRKSSVEA